MNDIGSITIEQVQSVYSGRPGCMCGCRGKYSANPLCQVSTDEGYPTNLRMVKKVLGLLQSNPRVKCDEFGGKRIFFVPNDLLADGERCYVLYAQPS